MAATYEATDSSAGVHDFVASPKLKRVFVNVGGGDRDSASTEAYTFANSETGRWLYGCADVQAFTNPEPGADGSNTGTFTLTLVITSGDTNVRFDDVILHRVNSSGVSQASVSTGTSMPVSMATGTHAFTFSSPALGTWAAGDYLGVEVQYTNTSTHGGDESVTFQFGNAASPSDLDTPFSFDVTVNATGLNAGPTFGSHDIDHQPDASALVASATFGTHDIALQIPATALDVPTLGTHSLEHLLVGTALDGSPSLGTHSVGYQVDHTALDAGPTFGSHTVNLAVPATALDAGPTLGSHSVEHLNAATALDAGPTLGSHSVQVTIALSATALDAGPGFGAPDVEHLVSAAALDASPTLGTHSVESGISLTATALDAGPGFGVPDVEHLVSAAALDASPTLGVHSVESGLSLTATALDAGPGFGSGIVSIDGDLEEPAPTPRATVGGSGSRLQAGDRLRRIIENYNKKARKKDEEELLLILLALDE